MKVLRSISRTAAAVGYFLVMQYLWPTKDMKREQQQTDQAG